MIEVKFGVSMGLNQREWVETFDENPTDEELDQMLEIEVANLIDSYWARL